MTEPALFDTAPAIWTTAPGPNPGMPDWLLRRLDAAGIIDAEVGASRKARATRCRSCRRPILIGFDGDWCALTVSVDPEPLSREGEAVALVLGIRTFMLSYLGGRYELDYRDRWRIRAFPAATAKFDVLVRHDCQRTTQLARAPSVLLDQAAAALPIDPPY